MTALRTGSASHPGLVRSVNQDSSLVAEPVFAVADGMGGHAAGEVASEVAVEALRANAEASRAGLVHAVRVANRAVWEKAAADSAMRGMGTTMCAIALVGTDAGDDAVVVVNVGDSRVYLFRDGELDQITEDHSLVEDLVREGRLTHEEAKSHPQRNVVTRVLGMEEDVEVDSWEITPYVGDRLLLCSDGLFNEVDEGAIAGVLRRLDDPDDAAAELVRLANEGGGRDNITIVLVDVVDDGGRAEAASAALGQTVGTGGRPAGDDPAAGLEDTASLPAQAHSPDSSDSPDATGAATPTRAQLQAGRSGRGRSRRLTWRVVAFSIALLAVVGGAVGAVAWFARTTYYVGVKGDDVAVFQGRPGGVLWFQPTLEEITDLAFDDVAPSRQGDVAAGKQEATLAGARRYVERLQAQAQATTTTTTTTTSAPTTTAPGAASSVPGSTSTTVP